MNWFNTLVVIGIAALLVPAFVAGGWAIALILVAGWLVITFGGRIGIDILKERQSGATAAKHKARSLTRERDDGQRWDR